MTEGIIIAIITAGLSFVGVVITVIYGNKKTTQKVNETVKEQTDLTLYRIEQLEKKQDIHNGVIERVYNLEQDVAVMKESDRVRNARIKDLESYHKPK